MHASRKKLTPTDVISFVPPSLRDFEQRPTFSAFLKGLEECISREVGVAQAITLWESNVAHVARDRELIQFCTFLKGIRWTENIESKVTAISPIEHRNKQLGAALAKLGPTPTEPSDPCYWFPAGRSVNAALQKEFGAANPIPVICEHLKAIFAKSDQIDDIPRTALNRTAAVDQMLVCLCAWVAEGQNDEARDAVKASLQMCCDLPSIYCEQLLDPGDVKALLMALRTPEPLIELAIERWQRDLDFESDDRLLQGCDLMSRLSLTQRVPLDAKLKKELRRVGVRFDSKHGPVIPTTVVRTMISVLYCRWLGSVGDDAPAFVERLPRLFDELTSLGRVKNEGRAPFSSTEGYAIAYYLHALTASCPQMIGALNPDVCEFVVLARALGRDRFLEPNYFDVGEYLPAPVDSCSENIANFFVEYKAFASAAKRLGLRQLAAAAWSFFLISVTVAFRGQLKVDWAELDLELRNALMGPGGEILATAVEFAATVADEGAEDVNALRLRELVTHRRRKRREAGSASRRRKKTSYIQLVLSNRKRRAECNLIRLIGEQQWGYLAASTQDHFIDGWLTSQSNRPDPVNPDIRDWGPLTMPFLKGIENELVLRMNAIPVEIIDEYYCTLGPTARRPEKWGFGNTVNWLLRYDRFLPRLKQAVHVVGLERVCATDKDILKRLRHLSALRNQAAHPNESFTENMHQDILVRLITEGFLSDFAEALAPMSE
jgi:hypothetical protein